jgi:hypothetical protein
VELRGFVPLTFTALPRTGTWPGRRSRDGRDGSGAPGVGRADAVSGRAGYAAPPLTGFGTVVTSWHG